MQRGTQLFLLLAIVLFALLGWKGLGLAVFLVFVLPVLLVLVLGLGFFLWARHRMNTRMAELRRALQDNSAQSASLRPDAIDVEGRVQGATSKDEPGERSA
jgi:pilus assembly protein TadC